MHAATMLTQQRSEEDKERVKGIFRQRVSEYSGLMAVVGQLADKLIEARKGKGQRNTTEQAGHRARTKGVGPGAR